MKGFLEFVYLVFKRKIVWRFRNKENGARCTNVYDIDCVSVGRYTYGPIDIEMTRRDVMLRIGSFCSIANGVKFILSAEHPMDHLLTYPVQELITRDGIDAQSKGDIQVDDDVWIGCVRWCFREYTFIRALWWRPVRSSRRMCRHMRLWQEFRRK